MSCKDNKHLRKRQEGFLKKTQKNKTHVRVSLRENHFSDFQIFRFSDFLIFPKILFKINYGLFDTF